MSQFFSANSETTTPKIKQVPIDPEIIALVNRILDQNQQAIEICNKILNENTRILTLFEFPKFNTSVLSDAAKYFKR